MKRAQSENDNESKKKAKVSSSSSSAPDKKQQLRAKLKALLNECQKNVFVESDIAGVDDFSEHKKTLASAGVIVVQKIFSDLALSDAFCQAQNAYLHDVQPQLNKTLAQDVVTLPFEEVVSKAKYWPSGIIGNASTGFLFAQPTAKEDVPMLALSASPSSPKIAMALGSGYRANVEIISHKDSKQAYKMLRGVTGQGYISQDSCKLYRGVLTKPHTDSYKNDDRRQAMAIGAHEGTVKLCFLRFSNHPEVQRLLGIESAVSALKGFTSVADVFPQFFSVFEELGLVDFGNPGDMVIWMPGTVHFEMEAHLVNGVKHFNPAADKFLDAGNTTTTTERYVIGTQKLVGFTPYMTAQIAMAADRGFFANPYHNMNANNPMGRNTVHTKFTRYGHQRTVSVVEKLRFDLLQEDILNPEKVKDWFNVTPKAKLMCYGVDLNLFGPEKKEEEKQEEQEDN